jgi:hypothetical protein
MSMTVQRLHKQLGALIEAGHGRKTVCVDKESFSHPLEADGAVILDVLCVDGPKWIGISNDDGGTNWNKDGTESSKHVVILSGTKQRCAA